MNDASRPSRLERTSGALWGMFVADSLAMPAHWFYSIESLKDQFNGGLTGYEDAPHPHPESFMVGMEYQPDVEQAQRCGRDYDILGRHSRFYKTTYSELKIETGHRESQHGNASPKEEERYHYHHGLKAGQNTLGAHLARVLLRSVAEEGRYCEAAFLEAFIHYMTAPEQRDDPYTEIYLRKWFENYASGKEKRDCAFHQRDIWSIGSLGGMNRPMILSMLADTAYQGLGFGLNHQILTHRSENVSAALGLSIPLLHDLLAGSPPMSAAMHHTASLRLPRITGDEMFAQYREHEGPDNIPDSEMWKLHTGLETKPFRLDEFAAQPPSAVVLEKLATACYPEHGLPLALYSAARHEFEPEPSLLADANAGGDNVGRGAVLGLLVGAASGPAFPEAWIDGLADKDTIANEIDGFLQVAEKDFPW
ncbi:ADP-ribosylglycohydrolase family protein [Puniceicoccus vermicola]|uniref:ADP-ribosylglycohydrolase family protein n=1 Tax=Puniceicoccus vermicola TaxID=388746 RepID=A0A7X1AUS0_9BACT|nr:ADP-ribosylglycohydrolase family protein [Puniceicoccus vermicola]MBC2600312.1 ADP-ribosylglycohydrolase family protein [Puniceicoccus vermicola]